MKVKRPAPRPPRQPASTGFLQAKRPRADVEPSSSQGLALRETTGSSTETAIPAGMLTRQQRTCSQNTQITRLIGSPLIVYCKNCFGPSPRTFYGFR